MEIPGDSKMGMGFLVHPFKFTRLVSTITVTAFLQRVCVSSSDTTSISVCITLEALLGLVIGSCTFIGYFLVTAGESISWKTLVSGAVP